MERYIWGLGFSQKIRTKEIREYQISFNENLESYLVTAHGYGFGKGVTVFGSKNKDECVTFINDLTIPVQRKEGGTDEPIQDPNL